MLCFRAAKEKAKAKETQKKATKVNILNTFDGLSSVSNLFLVQKDGLDNSSVIDTEKVPSIQNTMVPPTTQY